MRLGYTGFALGVLATALLCCSEPAPIDYAGPTADWPGFGGGNAGLRYSPLTQVDASNVQHLELARPHEDDAPPDFVSGPGVRSGFQVKPTGNPSPDHYGGQRDGLDQYGSSTVALDAQSGELVWQFQVVHHDLWDFDVPAQPELFQIDGVGGGRPGVAQSTKMGFLFLLDRETGLPLYPVEERPVPQAGSVEAELLSPTQAFPTHPEPLHPLGLEAWGFPPYDRSACEALIAQYRNDGLSRPLRSRAASPFPTRRTAWTGAGSQSTPSAALR